MRCSNTSFLSNIRNECTETIQQTDIQTDSRRQTDRQPDRQPDGQTRTVRQTANRHRQTDRQDRETDRQTDRQTQTDKTDRGFCLISTASKHTQPRYPSNEVQRKHCPASRLPLRIRPGWVVVVNCSVKLGSPGEVAQRVRRL